MLEGRQVIVTRTFSKLFGVAAMRLGFAIATPEHPAGRLACPGFLLCGIRLNEDALTPAKPE